jgi:hypothetical protein
MLDLLKALLEEFQTKLAAFSDGTPREAKLPQLPNKISVAIGMRRTGKTYFLLQIIAKLLQDQMPLSRVLYLNFEDDRLYPLNQQQLGQLLDSFYSLYPENHHQECYLFLDEIQNVTGWQLVVRRYFDTKRVRIYLTGSSAKLLSKEIATSLRGRSLATEIWPFSFNEFSAAHQYPALQGPYGRISLDTLTLRLRNYLDQGGFPEVIHFNQEERQQTLQDYVNVVVFRDVIERHNITNITLVRYLVKALLKNVGSLFSVHKFHNDLKTQGIAVGKTTIHHYLSYIEDAYLAFTVPLYSESLRKTHANPRKIYAIDSGLAHACTFGFSENIGHYFENLVYLDLRRAGHEVYYYLTKNRKEVDFLSRDLYGKLYLFQVCWNMDDAETQQREMTALKEAEQELKITGICVTPHTYFSEFLPRVFGKQ